jgi:hypothetical protein
MTTSLVARPSRSSRGASWAPRDEEAWKLLSRDVTSDRPLEDEELEYARLAGHSLPSGTAFWSKSGDAYDVRHLVARIRLPSGVELVLAVFTKGVHNELAVIPRVFAKVAARYETGAAR